MGPVQNAYDVEIPVVRKLMMEPADDVELGRPASLGLRAASDDLLVGAPVRATNVTRETSSVGLIAGPM